MLNPEMSTLQLILIDGYHEVVEGTEAPQALPDYSERERERETDRQKKERIFFLFWSEEREGERRGGRERV